jgi:hypothetical protein
LIYSKDYCKIIKHFSFLPEQLKAIKIDTSDDFKPAPAVNDVIGNALSRIGPYKKLDNSRQVVALIDDVRKLFSELF